MEFAPGIKMIPMYLGYRSIKSTRCGTYDHKTEFGMYMRRITKYRMRHSTVLILGAATYAICTVGPP